MNHEKHFQSYLLQRGYSQTSVGEYLRGIRQFSQWCIEERTSPENCSYNDLTAFAEYMRQREVAPSTINNLLSSIRHYLRYLTEAGKRNDNPAVGLSVRGTVKRVVAGVLSEKELGEIFKNFSQLVPKEERWQKFHKRDSVLLGLLIYQGLTVTELRQLLVSDINLGEGTIQVPQTRRGNGRTLKLDAAQMLGLSQYLAGKNGERLFDRNLKNVILELTKKLNKLTGRSISIQLFRSSRIVLWLEKENIRQVQYYAGVRYISSIEKYRMQQTEDLRGELVKYHPMG